ncbi:MAG: hypothetical protein FJ086_16530, partial [Deltaproteobacteria bacterium]|nr:hypothetical protein [Deltaproteobacteria bacterium]
HGTGTATVTVSQPLLANGASCSTGTQCASGFCADGVCCNTACDGPCDTCLANPSAPASAGTCTPRAAAEAGSPSCFPSLCSGTTAACASSCASDVPCAAGAYCDSGSCRAQLALGTACTSDNACTSGHCVDGVCCNTACGGQCAACNLSGQEGTCVAVVGAPRGGRPACDGPGSACAGSCDGTDPAACAYPGAAQACRGASCSAGVATLAAHCDGAGACAPLQTVDCGAYACGATACLGNCATAADCDVGLQCAGGMCVPLLAQGASCFDGAECATGQCVDGVCCNSACTGQCEACNVAGAAGTCTPVSGAPRGSRAACAGSGTCGGSCDGTNGAACSYPGAAVACRAGSCASGTAVLAADCDGQGGCPPEQQQSCAPFTCGATGCAGNCATDAECAAGSWCSGGVCVAVLATGQSCSAASQCSSGHCVDGACCETACAGACEACAEPGSVGNCVAVSGTPRGGRAPCEGLGACAGECDGTARTACSAAQPGTESCNGLDDDCDGTADDGAALCGEGQACQAGSCAAVPGVPGVDAGTGPGGDITGSCGCTTAPLGSLAWMGLLTLGAVARRRPATRRRAAPSQPR